MEIPAMENPSLIALLMQMKDEMSDNSKEMLNKMDDKAKKLENLKSTVEGKRKNVEDVEIMKHHYYGVEKEMNSNASRVAVVNQLARQLLHVEHPDWELAKEKPEFATSISPKIEELADQFDVLEQTTKEKGERLFDANREVLIHQTCDDIDSWMNELEKQIESDDTGSDLASLNILLQKRQMIETQMAVKARQVNELEKQTKHLETAAPDKDINKIKKLIDEAPPHEDATEFSRLMNELHKAWQELKEALDHRRANLLRNERAQQYLFDANEAESWMSEQEVYMRVEDRDKDEASFMKMKKHESLEAAVEAYADTIRGLGETVKALSAEGHRASYAGDRAKEITNREQEVVSAWARLQMVCEPRKGKLAICSSYSTW
ncbi:hypothetical protein D910_11215 [Dendroctonus ponderosae]|uniref:Uncharacterized protein n=1 Tax=Dendroctonus ponderosae TaxID=77166 RepID=U4UIS1_DENPD|nr:hypothetical protein D910_11215 [Dendroctonus ponderosae]